MHRQTNPVRPAGPTFAGLAADALGLALWVLPLIALLAWRD